MDRDGTDDSVSLEICSDAGPDCCRTGVLDSALNNDWSALDKEEWGAAFLGECEDRVFSVSQGFSVKLSKEGEDSLGVRELVIEAGREECASFMFWDLACDIVDRERFSCGKFMLGDSEDQGRTRSRQTKRCKNKVNIFYSIYCHELNVTTRNTIMKLLR